jgi:hypothetical protein
MIQKFENLIIWGGGGVKQQLGLGAKNLCYGPESMTIGTSSLKIHLNFSRQKPYIFGSSVFYSLVLLQGHFMRRNKCSGRIFLSTEK